MFLFLLPNKLLAQEYFFQDEFNENRLPNILDQNKWTVYPNNSSGVTTILENSGNLILSQVTTNKFPFVISKTQVFPNNDWTTEIKFQYTQITGYGTGIALTDKNPIQNPNAPELLRIDVWQDRSLSNMRLEYSGQIVFTTPLNLNSHVFKVERKGLKYLVYLDNNLVFTSGETQNKVQYIWMGNYVQVPTGPWTKFNVDYIRVKSTAPPKTPLILVPGIGGSELKVQDITLWNKDDNHGGVYNRVYAPDEKVWVNEGEAAQPGNDDYFDVLRMKTDGITSEASIGITDNLVSRAYGEAINFFTDNGYVLGTDFFVFPYDWRKDISETKNLLDDVINDIKDKSGSSKIDIVAHSMGGLVARNYIADPSKAPNVRKLFTLGTPHLGAVKFLKAIRQGYCLLVEAGPFCLSIAPSEMKDVIQNMISGYELAPSQTYYNFYNGQDNQHPYPYRTESGTLNYLQIKNLLATLGHNAALFNPSETFHAIDSILSNTNGVEVTNVVGSGQPTLGQIIEEKTISLLGIQSTHKDVININGDETVPLLSASFGSSSVFYTNQKHGELPGSGPALNLVKNILSNNNQIPNGVATQPYKFNGTSVSSHSPVNIHVYDVNNNHTGPLPNGDFEVNIPGSSYDTLGDAKFIFLPDDGVYNINFEATDQGNFDFKIRKYENDENTKTILYKETPLTNNNTKAETVFDTNSVQPPIISVDENGDGAIDFNQNPFSILEGNANFDYNPPVISLNVNPKTIWPPNNKMVDVSIVGNVADENPYLVKIMVEDEYDLVEPQVVIENQTNINQTIKLEASRKGTDKDGRIYTIKILATDLVGNTSMSTYEVTVLHDQRKK